MSSRGTLTGSPSPANDKKYVYFSGYDQYSIPDTDINGLDTTGSFCYAWQQQLVADPLLLVNYAIFSKGHPTNPSTGSVSACDVNGKLRVYLHASNGTNSLVYESASPILKDSTVNHFEINWNNTTKTFVARKNSIDITMTIVTGGSNYTLASSLTAIRENDNPFIFGQATGKNGFIGRVFNDILINGRVNTSGQNYAYYNAIKFVGTYPTLGTILFSSDQSTSTNSYEIHTMTSEAGSIAMIPSLTGSYRPQYSFDGAKILFMSGGNIPYFMNTNGSSVAPVRSDINFMYTQTPTWLYNGWILLRDNPSNWRHIYNQSGTLINGISPDNNSVTTISVGHPTSPTFLSVASWNNNASIIKYTFTGNVNITSTTILQSFSNIDEFAYSSCKYSRDGNYIGYSRRETSSGKYEIYIMSSEGANVTQLTAGVTYDSHFICFSPDGTKILYSTNENGKYQLYIMNVNGANKVNISNDAFNNRYGDWKA